MSERKEEEKDERRCYYCGTTENLKPEQFPLEDICFECNWEGSE